MIESLVPNVDDVDCLDDPWVLGRGDDGWKGKATVRAWAGVM